MAGREKVALHAEVDDLKERLEKEKAKAKDLWRANCMQVAEFDTREERRDSPPSRPAGPCKCWGGYQVP